MAREGTRSATGNSKPRVFQQVDTAPTIKRSRQPKTAGLLGGKTGKTTGTTTAPGAGVIAPKKKTTTAKKPGVVAKVRFFPSFFFLLPLQR